MVKRVLLFGVDGLTFDIVNPLVKRGLLPNFQRLHERGVRGVLRSTVPPLTPPAWMSIATGVSPAQHGTYDLWEYVQGRNEPTAAARMMTHRKAGKAVWHRLSDWGKQVIVANVPLTYPPEPLNGVMLSGYMAPGMQADVTYPKSFKDELLQSVPNYQIDLHSTTVGGQSGDILAETMQMTQERIAMMRMLLAKPWDFFFIVFTGADRIQHLRWQQIIAHEASAIAYYQMLDDALGLALDALHEDDLLMIVSDHGFRGTSRVFYVQEYLQRQGWLKVRDQRAYRQVVWRSFLTNSIRKLLWSVGLQGKTMHIRRQFKKLKRLAMSQPPTSSAKLLPDLDWQATRAWCQSPAGDLGGYADIYFDDSVTEEEIEQLASALLSIVEPQTGNKLVAEVHRETAFGTGPFAPRERHLIVIANEGMTFRISLGVASLWQTCLPYGVHHPDGVCYLYGHGIEQGKQIAPVHVYDVVPTILAHMHIPASDELAGRVMTEAFEPQLAQNSQSIREDVVRQKLNKLCHSVS